MLNICSLGYLSYNIALENGAFFVYARIKCVMLECRNADNNLQSIQF